MGAPTQWRGDYNIPDRVQVTSMVSTASTTTVETATAAFSAPWDVVTATADGDGYVAGDYVFPISPEGEGTLGDIFTAIEAACGLPVKRRRDASDDSLEKRDSVTVTECARDYIASSEVAAWDAGFSLSLGTITAYDAAVTVEGLSAAALVVLTAWVLGNGKVPTTSSPVIQSTSVGLVNDDLVNADDENEEDDPLESIDAYLDNWIAPSSDDINSAASDRADWQQKTPYPIRTLLRDFPGTDPTCQKSEAEIPLSSAEGTPDAASSITSFCSDNAGKQLTTDDPSVWNRYVYDDHSYWLVASIWAESPSSHCDYIWVDPAECLTSLSYGYYTCDPDSQWLHGSQWQGECVNYTLTVDVAMTRAEPPSWDDAGTQPSSSSSSASPSPSPTAKPTVTNSCTDPDGHASFSLDEATQAINTFCSADRNVDSPLVGGSTVDGIDIQMVMKKSSGSTFAGCPSFQSGYVVSADDCKLYFLSAVNNCNTDTTSAKYGQMPLTWNSPGGCIDFMIYANA
jgi:hypothetical protein